jgi:hypothetical protein
MITNIHVGNGTYQYDPRTKQVTDKGARVNLREDVLEAADIIRTADAAYALLTTTKETMTMTTPRILHFARYEFTMPAGGKHPARTATCDVVALTYGDSVVRTLSRFGADILDLSRCTAGTFDVTVDAAVKHHVRNLRFVGFLPHDLTRVLQSLVHEIDDEPHLGTYSVRILAELRRLTTSMAGGQ